MKKPDRPNPSNQPPELSPGQLFKMRLIWNVRRFLLTPSKPKPRIPRPPGEKGFIGRFLDRIRQRHQDSKAEELAFLDPSIPRASSSLMQLIGFGLLILMGVELGNLLIPPQFTNPVWEIEVIRGIIERIAVPMLGFLCLYYERDLEVKRGRVRFLARLSWLLLVIGVLCLLMIPLIVVNTARLDAFNRNQIQNELFQRNQSIQQIQIRLEAAKTNEQIVAALRLLNPQVSDETMSDPQSVRNRVLGELKANRQSLGQQAQKAFNSQRQSLVKRSTKLVLDTLFSGVIFILFWRLTAWTRQLANTLKK